MIQPSYFLTNLKVSEQGLLEAPSVPHAKSEFLLRSVPIQGDPSFWLRFFRHKRLLSQVY